LKHFAGPVLALAVLLQGCGQDVPLLGGNDGQAGAALDEQAIAVGILPDPEKTEFAGQYETRSDLGVDKFCAVKNATDAYDVGFLAVFGPESKCEGKGQATVVGEAVQVRLSGAGPCNFTARYDGIELRFSGVVEEGCARYCSDRASLSGTHYFMVESDDAAARKTLGRDIERLCG